MTKLGMKTSLNFNCYKKWECFIQESCQSKNFTLWDGLFRWM